MRAALENGGGADLKAGALAGDDQGNVVIAVQNLLDAVMQEADADDAFADAHLLGGAGAGLGILGDVLVQFDEILHGLVMALHLHHGVDDELGGAGGVGVGHPDQALVLGLDQVVPALGGFQAQALQLLGVHHEAQDALVDAVPVAVRVAVHGAGQIGGVLGFIGHEQTGLGALVVGVGGAAEPHVAGGIAGFLGDLGLHLARGQALVVGLDAVQLLKVLGGGGHIGLLAGAVHHQLALLLGGLDQFGVYFRGGGKAHAAKRHRQCEKKCKQFLHRTSSPFPNIDLFA